MYSEKFSYFYVGNAAKKDVI